MFTDDVLVKLDVEEWIRFEVCLGWFALFKQAKYNSLIYKTLQVKLFHMVKAKFYFR
jgi:hypothetical protein